MKDKLKRLISGEIDDYEMEKRYFHKNGKIVWVNLSVSAVKDQNNSIIRFLALVEDITKKEIGSRN